MKRTILLLSLLITGMLLTAGCTGTPAANNSTPAPAASPSATLTNTTMPGASTSAPITLPAGTTTTIELRENPTTGYVWNVTLSPGLTIVNTTYLQDNGTADKVGAGGTHQWLVRAVSAGNQTFSAIYKRPWEPATGNETQFTQFITVI
jgi:inhibitor of cysteine peptidase